LSGFGVRVMPSGRRFYFVRYRNKHGRSRWFTIGEHGEVTADAGRAKAQRILQAVVVDGSDPSGEREAFRAAPTVSELLDRYLAEHVDKKNRPCTRRSFQSIVERDIRPVLGPLKVAAVTRQDVHRLHAARADAPRQANLILAVCSKAFSLAELWEMRPEGGSYPEKHRERFLSAEELGRLGATLRQAETAGLPVEIRRAHALASPEPSDDGTLCESRRRSGADLERPSGRADCRGALPASGGPSSGS
jgi:hypothetical protein